MASELARKNRESGLIRHIDLDEALEHYVRERVRPHKAKAAHNLFKSWTARGMPVVGPRSGEDDFADIAVNVGEPEVAARVPERQLCMIEAKQMQNSP
jgi:hypothetical protein